MTDRPAASDPTAPAEATARVEALVPTEATARVEALVPTALLAPAPLAPALVAPDQPAPGPPSRPSGWLLGYPTDHLMGILPSPAAADAAVAELIRDGVPPGAIRVLVGMDAARRIDGRGKHHGLLARVYRLIQFTQMDQAPDFRRYELEASRGHPVIAVRETDPIRRRTILPILRRHGAHFTNFYARFFTETLDPYEGPDEGDLPI